MGDGRRLRRRQAGKKRQGELYDPQVQHKGFGGRGEGEGNAHIVYAPERGQVGVVLLTSLNVPSSKVCASL